jgi:putative spermidine/putrescine transport system substrate-binding protein
LTIKHSMPRLLTLGAGLMIVAAACGSSGGGSPAATTGAGASGGTSGGPAAFNPDPALVTAAKAEGALNTIALPRDWCNYGEIIDGFSKLYPEIKYNGISPDAGSGDEIQAIKSNPNGGPAAPDVVDVGFSFGADNAALFQPYKVATFDTIPNDWKDPTGLWYTDYYGVLSFEVNADIVKDVPQDWSDLLKPGMKVALAGNPTSSNQAIQSVYAASLGNGGSLDNGQPGLDFFKKLNDAGNFVPTIAKQGSLVSGETPIVITWNYLATADQVALKGTVNVQVVIPKTGRFAGSYVQAISKTAPHPNAAKLWEEYLYSDVGQTGWLKGFCYTARFDEMSKDNKIDSGLKAQLPDVTGAVFPTGAQLATAKTLITDPNKGWNAVTGVTTFKTPPPAP